MNQLTTETQKNNFCKSALLVKRDIEFSFLQLGEMLHRIKKESLFEAGWSSWEEYEMELKMSSATISKIMRIYEIFVLRYSFTPKLLAEAGGWSMVAEILPVISETTPRQRVEELLDNCINQSRTDVRRTIQEARSGIEMKDCKHDFYTIRVCRICGLREKIYDKDM